MAGAQPAVTSADRGATRPEGKERPCPALACPPPSARDTPSFPTPRLPPGSRQHSSFPMGDPARQALPLSRCLPRRWSLVCWAVVGTTSLTSAFWTVLYSLELSREQATHWALTVLLSLLQSFLLMQPLKVCTPTHPTAALWQAAH